VKKSAALPASPFLLVFPGHTRSSTCYREIRIAFEHAWRFAGRVVVLMRTTMLEVSGGRRGHRPFDPESARTWSERLVQARTAFGNVPGAFRLVWRADRRSTLVMAALTLVAAALPAAQAWAGTLIVDSVVDSFTARVDPLAGLERTLPT
jgi:hypothetical protein